MRIPVLRGIIDRRILVNFRVDPDVLARVLPEPFRPKQIHGTGMAGICLIRLNHIRPRFLPPILGISSENAAHRIAVQWEQEGDTKEGVYIPRRDTSSRLSTLVGGRLFPGIHHHAHFDVKEEDEFYSVALRSDDGTMQLAVSGRLARQLPETSVFRSLREASEFFEVGSIGYSATSVAGHFDGLELRTFNWRVRPLAVEKVESSFFDDRQRFPADSVAFDCALLMREVEHEWLEKPALCCEAAVV